MLRVHASCRGVHLRIVKELLADGSPLLVESLRQLIQVLDLGGSFVVVHLDLLKDCLDVIEEVYLLFDVWEGELHLEPHVPRDEELVSDEHALGY